MRRSFHLNSSISPFSETLGRAMTRRRTDADGLALPSLFRSLPYPDTQVDGPQGERRMEELTGQTPTSCACVCEWGRETERGRDRLDGAVVGREKEREGWATTSTENAILLFLLLGRTRGVKNEEELLSGQKTGSPSLPPSYYTHVKSCR